MWKHRDDYIKRDEIGRRINTEFPPESFTKYPSYNGYKNPNMEALYYWFGVQYYDMRIEYKGNTYLGIVDDDDGAYITDADYNQISEAYPTGNNLIKNYKFPDGKMLPELALNSSDIFIDIF